jgi:chemotaxis protein histidine kinase CheA
MFCVVMRALRVPAGRSRRWRRGAWWDELLRDFLTETSESLDLVDAELVHFEQEPNNGQILGNIFCFVHTIKGTCGLWG